MQQGDKLMYRYFCTLFDSNYLFKGTVMLRSLLANCPKAHVFVLCMDEQCRRLVMKLDLPGITCLSLSQIETEELLAIKGQRSVAEYCWTLSPCLPSWILERYRHVEMLTYIDADLMFYSSVEPLFSEIGAASIAIIEHRFTPSLKHLEVNGRFCVEWVSFRRDVQGLACLSRWRAQCIEWCYSRLDNGRMGDQKYLDEWPERYPSTHVLQHEGAGVAPWNFPNYRISTRVDGLVTVNDVPLIFYHFHQFQLLADGSFDRLSSAYTEALAEPEVVYRRYESQLTTVVAEVRSIAPGFSGGLKSKGYIKSIRAMHRLFPRWLKEFLKRVVKP